MIWWLPIALAATAVGSHGWTQQETQQETRQEPQKSPQQHQPSLVPS
jgi:hypothetical protein